MQCTLEEKFGDLSNKDDVMAARLGNPKLQILSI